MQSQARWRQRMRSKPQQDSHTSVHACAYRCFGHADATSQAIGLIWAAFDVSVVAFKISTRCDAPSNSR